MTTAKRYQRYKPAFAKKVNTIIEHETRADKPKTNEEISELIALEFERMLNGGTLNDAGFDYSEGDGHILVYVTKRT